MPETFWTSTAFAKDGVVVSGHRLSSPIGFDNLWLETTTPSAPAKERDHFFMAQPLLLREGGVCVMQNRRAPQMSHYKFIHELSRWHHWSIALSHPGGHFFDQMVDQIKVRFDTRFTLNLVR